MRKKKVIAIFLLFIFGFVFNPEKIFASVNVSIQNYPPQVYSNEEFNVVFTIIKNPPTLDSYYIKGRVGNSSATMNQGETFNPTSNSWFSDTSSWTSSPITTLNNQGIATTTAKLRTKTTVSLGPNSLIIRIKETGGQNSYDSSPSALLVLEPPSPTPTITPIITSTPTPTPTEILISETSPTPTIPPPSPTPTPAPHSYDNIYLSEAMVYPETDEHEWVEIYNDNDYTVSLKNWYLDDIENGGSAPKLFSLDIPAKGFAVYELTSSVFNNDGDQVRLLDFNRVLKDDFEYLDAIKGKTFGKNSLTTDEFCLQESTKNTPNNPCLNPTNTPTPTPQPTLTPTKTPPPIKTPTPTLMIINNVETQNFGSLPTTNINLPGGQILGTENQNQLLTNSGQNITDKKSIVYVKGFTTSSFFISLLNIFYIAHKIIRRLNSNETI